jgi:hypothetical protein
LCHIQTAGIIATPLNSEKKREDDDVLENYSTTSVASSCDSLFRYNLQAKASEKFLYLFL